jgi:hypothetical protein
MINALLLTLIHSSYISKIYPKNHTVQLNTAGNHCLRIEARSFVLSLFWLLFQRTTLSLLGHTFLLFHMWYTGTQRYFPTQKNSTLTTSCLKEFRVDTHLLTFHSVPDPETALVRHDLWFNVKQFISAKSSPCEGTQGRKSHISKFRIEFHQVQQCS